MIKRYTREQMGEVWAPEKRFEYMLQVEIAVAKAQAKLGLIPQKAYKDIATKSKFSVKRIEEIEQETKHDVIAFVSAVAENIGPSGAYLHFGMTSSDVLDTAFSLQIRDAGAVLLESLAGLQKTLKHLVETHIDTLCAGRTHGMFAEPTTFGFKLAGFLAETNRNISRVSHALGQLEICKMSGAVGTYSSQPPEVEALVAKELGLEIETLATQVIPRDRHAELFSAFAILAGSLERLSIELRHLQRSEVSEVIEGFTPGQKGSSAMPHKKNPISAENITGLARLIRGYAQSAMDNISLWHERDISHSSVERVIFPDAFIVLDYAVDRMQRLLSGLHIDKKRMLATVELSQGTLFSSHVLLALVEQGKSREAAYKIVQRLSHSLKSGEHLKGLLMQDSESKKLLNKKQLDEIFSGKAHLKFIKNRVKAVLKEA